MIDGWTIVLDVGKTHAKLTLRDGQGRSHAVDTRPNGMQKIGGQRVLDVIGIEQWLFGSLAKYARQAVVRRIIPVAHGAAAAILRAGRLMWQPLDYEAPVSEAARDTYVPQRDPFSATGSPLLPDGLNLGMQLHVLESRHGTLPDDATILPWPQFWAWRLCGIAAAEVTSLGCHTDLWRPKERRFSDLAARRGWARRMAPLRHAADVLGRISPEVVAATGLPADCEVFCGLHDSNAALLAACPRSQTAGGDATVLATGTWFVAMRRPAPASGFDAAGLAEDRDCLINVDVDGNAVPSGRFMGGREAELIRAHDWSPAEPGTAVAGDLAVLRKLLDNGLRIYPGFVRGVGPFPDAAGELRNLPGTPRARSVAASLYLALMADAVLDLIGSRDHLLLQGRFSGDALFAGLLAALRGSQRLAAGGAMNDLAGGVLRLVAPELSLPVDPVPVAPLDIDLAGLVHDWRRHASASLKVH